MRTRSRIVTSIALLAAAAVPAASEPPHRLSGTWVIQRVEQRTATGEWQPVATPAIGMLIYDIAGPMQHAPDADTAADTAAAPAQTNDPDGTSDAPDARRGDVESLKVYLDDGATRMIWTRGTEVR